MTEIQKAKIRYFRTEGMGYGAIAEKLEISENTVKSFCRRNGLTGVASKEPITICRQCNQVLEQEEGRKHRKFCSEKCRRAWWKAHPELVTRKAYYTMVCAHCGKVFRAYGNKGRKYCGHPCYIAARFGEGDLENGGASHGKTD